MAVCTTAGGGTIFWYAPSEPIIQFFVSEVRRSGREDDAAQLLDLLGAVNGGPVTPNYPVINGDRVLEHWEAFVEAARYCPGVVG